MCFNINTCIFGGLKLANVRNFHPLGVVARGSETQLQVDENLDAFV